MSNRDTRNQVQDLDSLLSNEVYPSLFNNLENAFPEFQFERRGDHWVAHHWPSGFPLQVEHKRPDRLIVYDDRPYWIKVHGHAGVRFLDLVNGGRSPHGAEFLHAVEKLCLLAGLPLPERRFTRQQEETAHKKESQRSILDIIMSHAQNILWSDEGREARNYLVEKRGFTEEEIRTLGFGLYLRVDDAKKALEQFGYEASSQEVKEAGVLWNKLQGYIFIPWHDDCGRPLTIYGRWPGQFLPLKKDLPQWLPDRDKERLAWEINPGGKDWTEPTVPKTIALPGEGTKRSPLFLDRALRTGYKDLVLVEGVFDGAILQVRGDARTVASGAAQLNHRQVETIVRRGIRNVYICGDPDSGGDNGTLANINLLDKNGIACFVVKRLPEETDPDDFVRANGIETWKIRVDNSIHAYRYIANRIIAQHKSGESWTDPEMTAVLDAAIQFDASVSSPQKVTDLDRFFWSAIYEATGVDEDALLARRQSLREKRIREKQFRSYQSLNDSTAKLLRAGNLEEAKELLVENIQRLQEEEREIKSDPVLCLSEELGSHKERLKKYRGKQLIGLPQKTIPKLDELTSGLRKLMLLAAAPNVGKTALGVQLGMDTVVHNPDACFLFVSLEMPRWDIYTRIKCRLAQMDWKTLVFGSGEITGRGQEAFYTSQELARLRDSDDLMANLGNRIRVLDERNFPNPTLPGLLFHLKDLKARTGAKRALVLLDYLQVWPIPESEARKIKSDLDSDKYRIGIMKTLRDATEDDAILVISEARKPAGKSGEKWGGSMADVMGSARGSYTPDMIFLFRPFDDAELLLQSGQWSKEMSRDERKELADQLRNELAQEGKTLNKFEITKGRDGVLRGTIDLTFWYRQSAFDEGTHSYRL